jgi:hypothetical protein
MAGRANALLFCQHAPQNSGNVDGSTVSVSEHSQNFETLLLAYESCHSRDKEEVVIVCTFKVQNVLLWMQRHCISVFLERFSYCGSCLALIDDFLLAQWLGIFAGYFVQ